MGFFFGSLKGPKISPGFATRKLPVKVLARPVSPVLMSS
jgi:hypothetical protein